MLGGCRTGLAGLSCDDELAHIEQATPEPSIEQSERQHALSRLDASKRTEIHAAEDAIYSAGGFEELLVPLWKRYISNWSGRG